MHFLAVGYSRATELAGPGGLIVVLGSLRLVANPAPRSACSPREEARVRTLMMATSPP